MNGEYAMNLEQAKQILESAGHTITDESRLGNNTGTRLKLQSGQLVNVFDNGTINVQGKNPGPVNELFKTGSTTDITTTAAAKAPRHVFVAYGHDATARTQLEAMLRRWGVEPMILDQLPSEGQTIIEKLEAAAKLAAFAVVLATPDDEGHRANRPDEKAYRARQNVVLELGMLLAKLGRDRVAVLLKQTEKMERPSDIQGLIYIPFKDNVEKDAGLLLAKEMAAKGFNIDVTRL